MRRAEVLPLVGTAAIAEAPGCAEQAAQTFTTEDVAQMPLDVFAEARLVVEVESAVLHDVVLFASDNALVDPGETRVAYRAAELKSLLGMKPDDLWDVREIKMIFKGDDPGLTTSCPPTPP